MGSFENDGLCFICGSGNPRGLRLSPQGRDGRCSFDWTPHADFQGWSGVLHGGIIAAVMDEAMAYAAMSVCGRAATAEITVTFRRPVITGIQVRVTGEVVSSRGRLIETAGRIEQDGECRAEARARFMAVPGGGEPPRG
jgi:uncharacterized protein (TIGR00369 family)